MKLFSTILLFWLSFLTVQPVVAEVCMALQKESCCATSCEEKMECTDEDSAPCKDENAAGKCCMEGCAPCAFCYCCFGATVERDHLKFINTAEKNNLTFIQNQNTLSGFLSSPFQPPEIS